VTGQTGSGRRRRNIGEMFLSQLRLTMTAESAASRRPPKKRAPFWMYV